LATRLPVTNIRVDIAPEVQILVTISMYRSPKPAAGLASRSTPTRAGLNSRSSLCTEYASNGY